MATIVLVPTSIVSQSGFTDATAGNLAAIDGNQATGGVATSNIVAHITDAPSDYTSLNNVVLRFRANTAGTVGRAKSVTLSLRDASNNVITTFGPQEVTDTATTYTSGVLTPAAQSAAQVNDWRLRVDITEAGGMADTATVSIDYIAVDPLDYTALSSIVDLDATATYPNVVLTWTDIANEEGYRVHRSLTNGFTPSGTTAGVGTCIAVKDANVVMHSDAGPFDSNTTYYYKVLPYSGAGTTDSNQASVLVPVSESRWLVTHTKLVAEEPPPEMPTASATTVSRSRIDLVLGVGVRAISHTLHRSTTADFTPSSGNQVAAFEAVPTSPHSDTGLDFDTPYYYRLRATNEAGSTDSTETTATTLANQPPVDPYIISAEVYDGWGILDLNSYTHGTTPADWTAWNTPWKVLNEERGTFQGKVFSVRPPTGARTHMTWSGLGAIEGDVRILMRARSGHVASVNRFGIYLHSQDVSTTGVINTYASTIYNNFLYTGKWVNSAWTDLGGSPLSFAPIRETWYWLRFERVGTTVRSKIWLSTAAEPGSWQRSATDSTFTSGYVVLYAVEAGQAIAVDYLRVSKTETPELPTLPAAPTTYVEDFSGFSVGTAPDTHFDAAWGDPSQWEIGETSGQKHIKVVSAVGQMRPLFLRNAGLYQNFDMVVKVNRTGTDTLAVTPAGRGAGDYTRRTIRMAVFHDSSGTKQLLSVSGVDGSLTINATVTYDWTTVASPYFVRFNVVDNVFQMRFWAANESEPGTWRTYASVAGMLHPGRIGLFISHPNPLNWNIDYVAVSYDGTPAPLP
jgi:hypothetical protein